MKIRRFLLQWRFWARYRRARREYKRLKRQLEAQTSAFTKIKAKIISHYENQLATERARNETLHLEWANRFLQKDKLAPLGVSTSLIQEKAALKLPEDQRTLPDDELDLSSNQVLELQDRKDQFFRDGLNLEKSYAEIANRWEDIKLDVMQDVRVSVT